MLCIDRDPVHGTQEKTFVLFYVYDDAMFC